MHSNTCCQEFAFFLEGCPLQRVSFKRGITVLPLTKDTSLIRTELFGRRDVLIRGAPLYTFSHGAFKAERMAEQCKLTKQDPK